MKILKSEVLLSESHPSLLLDLNPEDAITAPLIIDRKRVLVDGYRRFLICKEDAVEAFEIDAAASDAAASDAGDLLSTAFELNRRTRQWDEIDCFLWMRWGRQLNKDIDFEKKYSGHPFAARRFPKELLDMPASFLRDIANRRLLLRQAQLILEAPKPYRSFFQNLLTNAVHLNANESAQCIEMAVDLAGRMKIRDMRSLFELEGFQNLLKANLGPKQRGERLLKELRSMRYPYYQKKLNQFSSNWKKLDLTGEVEVNNSMFVERGNLEIRITSRSLSEFRRKVVKLHGALNSPELEEIWEE